MAVSETAKDHKAKSLISEEEHEKQVIEECNSFFRIHPREYPKFFSIAVLGFNISFIYSTLRDGKDTIVLSKMLPASIPYLKTFLVLFFTILFGVFFQFLMSKGITMKKIMIYSHIIFGAYFVLYSLVISQVAVMDKIEPYKFLVLDLFSDEKMNFYGHEALKGFFMIFNFWTSALFYLTSEMWGSVVLSLLFFGCVNELCQLRQALRFYPLLMIGANIALVLSGVLGVAVSCAAGDNTEQIYTFYRYYPLVVAAMCAGNVVLYSYLMEKIVPYPIYIVDTAGPKKAGKAKVGMVEGIIAAFYNPIVLCLSISVLGYGMVTNLTEGAYNTCIAASATAKGASKGKEAMLTKAIQQVIIGFATILCLLSPLKTFIQKRGWLSLGLLSPVLSMIGSLVFLFVVWVNIQMKIVENETIMVKIGKSIGGIISINSYKNLEKHTGMIVTSVIKILKYAAFDICKEAIGVKIPKEHRSRFKGVYDGVFGKLGKSTASGIQIVLLSIFKTSDIRESVIFTASYIVVITAIWTYASVYLGVHYSKAVREGKDLKIVVPEVFKK
ncbi:ATP:ADP antiporter, AAA family [Nematocida sp. AWRm77]|nr:ATP:ADP antiporter, AAA family [Nematocida sp. AWRm77]